MAPVPYSFGHIALFVSDLREAEAFYTRTFDMEVLFREAEGEDGQWRTLPPGRGWHEAEQAGVEIGMVALRRDQLVLPIFRGRPRRRTVLEIGVTVDAREIQAILGRLPDNAVRRLHEYDDLLFEDPYGFVWHINTSDDGFLSNGEIAGHWLDM